MGLPAHEPLQTRILGLKRAHLGDQLLIDQRDLLQLLRLEMFLAGHLQELLLLHSAALNRGC